MFKVNKDLKLKHLYFLCFFKNSLIYSLSLIFPNVLYILFDKLKFVNAEAYLSPFLEGKYFILELNIFATSKIVKLSFI